MSEVILPKKKHSFKRFNTLEEEVKWIPFYRLVYMKEMDAGTITTVKKNKICHWRLTEDDR